MVTGAGFSLVELLFVLAILATLAGIGIPLTTSALDEMRVGMAARYVAGRIVGARLDALQRSTALGLRFDAGGVDYSFATCVDGNGNGLRTAEIASGTDQQITPAEFLGQRFADVQFGLSAGVPDLDGGWQTEDSDGVRHRIVADSHGGTRRHGHIGHALRPRQARAIRDSRPRSHGAGASLSVPDRSEGMDCAVSERRAHERTEGELGHIAKATLRPGHPILVVNISRGGALIEGTRPLRPGTRVMLQVATSTGALGLSALVLRCGVQALSVEDGVLYRGALKFDDRRDWTREVGTLAG